MLCPIKYLLILNMGLSLSSLRKHIEQLCKTCTIQDFTKEIVLMASSMKEKYSFSFWDSIIVGSALFSECTILINKV
jgi:predicted nucleic acid-binding protein